LTDADIETLNEPKPRTAMELKELARSRRLVDDQVKTVKVNGALECSNSFCPAFRVGYTVRPRDGQAAVNIGIAGFSALGLDATEDSSNNPTKEDKSR
ncbi:hypothetical protein BGZ65_005423, partial [Modicella reniformis]